MISDKQLRTYKAAKWGRGGPSFLLASLGTGAILPWLLAGMGGALLGVYALGISILPQRLAMLAVLAFLLPIGLLIAGNVKKILLGVILFEIPLQLDAYLGHQEAIADLNAISGINISITTLCLLILYGLWLAESLAGEAAPTPNLGRLSRPMIGYVGVVCLALIFANEAWLSVYELVILIQAFFLYIYLVHAVRSRQDLIFVMTILLAGLLLQALIMIGVRIVGHDITVASISATISKGGRVAGTIGSPNTASSYLTLLLAPALSLLLMQNDVWRKLLAISSFGLGSVALILTLSRGAWIGVAFSVMLLFFLAWQRGWISLTIPLALGLCVLVLMIPLQDLILERIFGDDNG